MHAIIRRSWRVVHPVLEKSARGTSPKAHHQPCGRPVPLATSGGIVCTRSVAKGCTCSLDVLREHRVEHVHRALVPLYPHQKLGHLVWREDPAEPVGDALRRRDVLPDVSPQLLDQGRDFALELAVGLDRVLLAGELADLLS